VKSVVPKVDVMHAVSVIKPLLVKIEKLKALCVPPKVDSKSDWTVVPGGDTKVFEMQAQLADAEMKTIVGALKMGIGYEAMKVLLPIRFAFTNTAANTCALVTNVDVGASNEWTAFQVLFDEYRWSGTTTLLSPLAASVASPVADGGMFCFGYDPDGTTMATSSTDISQLAHHKVFCAPNASITGASAVFHGAPWTFEAKVKNREVLNPSTATGAVTYSPGTWKSLPTPGSNGSFDGVFKVYWLNASANSAIVFTSISYYHVQFRSRK